MQDPILDAGAIRKLWIGETGEYRAHLLRLDEDSRRSRFGGVVSDELIRMYVDHTNGLSAVLHGFFVDGTLRGVGELRLFGSPMSDTAEAAFSIEKLWQSHGVGAALLDRTILAARNRGIKHLHMICLPENQRMQQLARKFHADVSFDFGSVVSAIDAPRATPLSLFRELVADGHGFAAAVLDAQARLVKIG